MRIGLLSTAAINGKLVEGARAAGVADVVAVGSRDERRARAHADELGIGRAHGSYEQLLADPDVDAIYVSLPNSMHVDWSIRALEAGKHVLCEKPLSRDPAAVTRAFDVAETHGRVLMEAFMWRHTPQTRRLLELLPRVGELRLVRATFTFPERSPDDIRMRPELDGGSLMDVGCYCVSAIRLLAGDPEQYAARRAGREGVDVMFAAALSMPGGVLAHFDCGMVAAPRDELEVVGSDAAIFLDDPWHARAPVIEIRSGDGETERVEVAAENPYACEIEEFAAVASGAREARFGRADAVGQATALARLHEAAR